MQQRIYERADKYLKAVRKDKNLPEDEHFLPSQFENAIAACSLVECRMHHAPHANFLPGLPLMPCRVCVAILSTTALRPAPLSERGERWESGHTVFRVFCTASAFTHGFPARCFVWPSHWQCAPQAGDEDEYMDKLVAIYKKPENAVASKGFMGIMCCRS